MKSVRIFAFVVLIALAIPILGAIAAHADGQTGYWGDQGDGTYRNPVIAADFSDPDVCRVGGDYYMVASTFESSPGITVLHSRDLVNWQIIGAAFQDVSLLGPAFNWNRMGRYAEGLFAPSIRYHAGKFWIFVNSHSGEGMYNATAVNPSGPWAVTQLKDKNGKPLRTYGWTDPCPFWDDDGKAYLATSRPSSKWYSYLFQMTPDGSQLLDADVDAMNVRDVVYTFPTGGTLFSPYQSSEGNKIYKRNGYYYLQHIEFLDSGNGHGTYFLRSRNIYGTKPDGKPGEPGDVGAYDLYKFGGDGPGKPRQDIPGQGGLVDTPDGRWFWIGQFNSVEADGRKPCLLPVQWVNDWPVANATPGAMHGEMVWQAPKPIVGGAPHLPLGSDEFEKATLDPQWQWNHQPRDQMWSLTERPGYLRLHAFHEVRAGQFFTAGNTLEMRYMRSNLTTATVKLDISGLADGQEAGLAHFNGGRNYATLGIVRNQDTDSLSYKTSEPMDMLLPDVHFPSSTVSIWLRTDIGLDNISTFSYSLDGISFKPLVSGYELRSAGYRGDFIGLYTFNNTADDGYVDADWFHYTAENKP